MAKMATMPIYGTQPSKILFSRTKSHIILNFGMQHLRLNLYKVCINADPKLTLAVLWQGQIWLPTYLNEETVIKSFNGKKLQQITKLTQDQCFKNRVDPRG